MKAKTILAILLLFNSTMLLAQIRIDWQQCYGSMETDEARSIIQNETGGYRVAGKVGEESGMVGCSFEDSNRCWLIEIDGTGEFLGDNCISNFLPSKLFRIDESSFYVAGVGNRNIYYDRFIEVQKYTNDGTLEWRTQAGNHEKGVGNPPRVALTADGGVVATSFVQWPCSQGGTYYGGNDAWVVKINSNGGQDWDIMLGSEGFEMPLGILGESNGNVIVAVYGYAWGYGNVASCNRTKHDAIITKLNADGEILWSRCYGGDEEDVIGHITELADGYLFAGQTESEDGDLEGAGYHLGYIHNIPSIGRTRDIWLMRTDFDGNVLWSRCYGGSGEECPNTVFQNEDGGFTVFGTSNSIDGDVQSGQNVHFPWDEYPEDRIWMFKTDGDGNLIWERAIGHLASRITHSDVIKHNDSEYTLAATSASPTDPMYQGDYNCSNSNLCHYMNYWVLHITDIFDYDAVEEGQIEARNMSVYPNPAQGMLTVSGKDIRQVCLYDLLGQQVATAPSYNGSNAMLSTSGLAAGIYMVQVRTENGTCVKRVVVSE